MIHFSTNRSVAESYEKYIYTLDISDDALLDFRKKAVAKKYVNAMLADVRKKTKVPVKNYLDVVSYQGHRRHQGCFAESCEDYQKGKSELLKRSRRKTLYEES